MAQIPHRYFEKLRGIVTDFEQWLASTEATDDGSISVDDLKIAFVKATSIYTKTLELYRIGTTTSDEKPSDDSTDDVSKLSPG